MTFKKTFTWLIGIAFVAYCIFIFVWFTKLGIKDPIWDLIIKQWLAMIIFPSACFATLVVVMVLDQVSGDIEFKVLEFNFKGAAAPLVMWALLNLVTAVCLHLLWQPEVNAPGIVGVSKNAAAAEVSPQTTRITPKKD